MNELICLSLYFLRKIWIIKRKVNLIPQLKLKIGIRVQTCVYCILLTKRGEYYITVTHSFHFIECEIFVSFKYSSTT